ncbi:MAG: Yqey-like protein [Alphaproteobacteria bacterium ADurb.BinA280]|nr:GatB/YqeY domain-containing protein [Xanthomonadales bacterium]MCC6505283.1 GatB/YqeY domain-containing protein [Aquimonas sp.]OPZ12714.1 MAG: Yqey-like protein [Alphaproteobacteria bacterium ADurb.BinA280]
MSLKIRLTEDMKAAMKGGAKEQLAVIRLILAALKQREVDERISLDDGQVLAVLEKMLKQRKDSVQQFEAASREDLAAQERYEIGVIQAYLPAQLGEDEINALIEAAISESGASTARDMGKVVGLLKPKLQGRADMGWVSGKIKERLGG